MSGPALYLFYDGDCPLCCRFKEWIDRLDTQNAVCAVNRNRKRLCLQCGEKWMPSLKYSRRNKDSGRRRRR